MGTVPDKILPYDSQANLIVDRVNKEVNRHIRAYTYDRATTASYKEILPFAQRILNTKVEDRVKVSLAQILYAYAINIDEGILIPRDEIDIDPPFMTTSTSIMLKMQDELIRTTGELLIESSTLR